MYYMYGVRLCNSYRVRAVGQRRALRVLGFLLPQDLLLVPPLDDRGLLGRHTLFV